MATAGGARGTGPERAFCDPLPASGRVALAPEEERHLRVRRARPGDEVVLFDGRGGTRLARVAPGAGGRLEAEVVGPYPDREPARRVDVACALPAAGRADDLVFALAECGVARLVPLLSDRSGPDAARRAAGRRERHERLAREAAKVNGRSRLLEVAEPQALAGVLAAWPHAAVLLDPDPALPRLPSALPGGPVLLLVGPEGGFSDAERDAAGAAGARAASLGTCVLRVETAAVVAAGIALGI